MKIYLNGEEKELTTARDVAAMVAELGLPGPALLIEHNGLALRRTEWPNTALTEGDRVEILRIAAGG